MNSVKVKRREGVSAEEGGQEKKKGKREKNYSFRVIPNSLAVFVKTS